MKLSVIIPVYNVEEYLRECLNSVLMQEFEEYEVLCVEDGSTDGSLDILKEYEKDYQQLRIIQHEKNRGLSAARNTGIKNARGKYIQFIDSDDLIKADTFKQLYLRAEETQADIVYFNIEFLNDEKNQLIRMDVENKVFDGIYTGREMFCLHQKEKNSKPEAVRQFIRRDFLLKSQIFFKEGIIHEDVLFSFLLMMEAKRVVDMNLPLYIYRQRNGSIMWSQKHKSAASCFVCVINICNYWLANNFTEEEDKWISVYIEKLYTAYKEYMKYQIDDDPVGNDKEKKIYDVFHDRYSSVIEFSDDEIEKLKTSEMNILYGAGMIAREVLKLVKKDNISIGYIAVTDTDKNPSFLEGIPVKSIQELTGAQQALVIIGTDEKWHTEICGTLDEYGFEKYIKPQFK